MLNRNNSELNRNNLDKLFLNNLLKMISYDNKGIFNPNEESLLQIVGSADQQGAKWIEIKNSHPSECGKRHRRTFSEAAQKLRMCIQYAYKINNICDRVPKITKKNIRVIILSDVITNLPENRHKYQGMI